MGAGDRIFFAFSFGPFLGFWVAFDAAARMGCLAIPGGGMRSDARLHAILDNRATVLCCTPTYAIRLGEAAAEEGIDLSAVGGADDYRRRRAGRQHSCDPGSHSRAVARRESGGSSRDDGSRPGELWVPEARARAARDRVVLYRGGDRSDDRASVASHGELVLTNLGRMGSPLIRYRTGDIVERSRQERCECGSFDLALEGGILARTDDMVVVRGVNLYPSAIEDVLRGCEGVAEYRVEIRTERALSELNGAGGGVERGDAGLAHRLESALRNAFALRIPVTLVGRGTLPRFEMKAQRWVRV